MTNSEDSHWLKVEIVSIVFLIVSWIAVLLRCYVRRWISRSFRIDDWLMLLSAILFSVYTAFNLVALHFGLGQRDVPQQEEIQGRKWTSLAALTYIILMAIIKCSIATFLLRIAIERIYRLIIYISMAMVIIYSLVIFFYNLFLCHPVEFTWNRTIEGGTCAPGALASSYALSALAIISDLLFALLPVPLIWFLKMNIRTKIFVFGVLSFGIVASIATIARLGTLININKDNGYLYYIVDTLNWTIIEISLAIIGGSIATFRPLLKALHIKGFISSDGANPGGVYGHPGGGQSLPLGSLEGGPDLGLRSDTAVDIENQWQNRVVVRAESCNAISRTGSEEMILTGARIKATTNIIVTHIQN
ncbi:uncharacterized protein PAC_18839 [Phialocephala subalpina]|uniref:Rhodopsin domain-containing protein n=1 Tax=Phialocephala subalpina TaxID=576137 RepID=A0A1L7XVA8_9HELO|nr:uncharacterized protein PAC_18839 [Phialocephala subalpina]